MDEKILTVTIPSYNVEAYLEECLESFVNSEVMGDIEVLIVNDGSSDDTAKIAQRYVDKYENTFRLINKMVDMVQQLILGFEKQKESISRLLMGTIG